MGVRLWQVCATAAIVVTLAIVVGDLLNSEENGGAYGMHAPPDSEVVDSVAPGSPAARVGIRPGDRVTLDHGDLTSRVRFERPVAGDRVVVDDERDGRTRVVPLVAAGSTHDSGLGEAILGIYETLRLVMIALALLIVVRRPDLPAARALANFFIAFAFGFLGRTPWYPPVVSALLDVLRPVAIFFAFEQAAIFAAIFPRPSAGGLRRLVERISPYLFVVTGGYALVSLTLYFFAGIPPPLDSGLVFTVYTLLITSTIAIGFVIGSREATPAERHRLNWISFSLAIGFAGLIAGVAFEVRGAPQEQWIFLPLTLVAVPIGTTYAILRHRVLDVGFVINRALVFGLISGIVVLAFGLLEWFLGKYLVELGHVGSSFIEAMLALALALSLRQIHSRVDHFVDSVFFRQRHLAERALRRLAHEVAFIDNAAVLGARTVEAVDHYARATGCAIYLTAGERDFALRISTLAAAPARIDANDPAIVAMRAFHEAVDLDDQGVARSQLAGAIGFPMVVRGELVGVLDCGPKRELEPYDPDERDTLHVLVRAVGHTYDAIRTDALRSAVDRALAGDGTLDELRAVRAELGAAG
jgi:hypothetical protein